jgi:hypothetical protein
MTRANTVAPPEHAKCCGRTGCQDLVAVTQPKTCVRGGATAPAVTAFGGDAGGETGGDTGSDIGSDIGSNTTGGKTDQEEQAEAAERWAVRTRPIVESNSISAETMCVGFVMKEINFRCLVDVRLPVPPGLCNTRSAGLGGPLKKVARVSVTPRPAVWRQQRSPRASQMLA